jgi:hypothetical protein
LIPKRLRILTEVVPATGSNPRRQYAECHDEQEKFSTAGYFSVLVSPCIRSIKLWWHLLNADSRFDTIKINPTNCSKAQGTKPLPLAQ